MPPQYQGHFTGPAVITPTRPTPAPPRLELVPMPSKWEVFWDKITDPSAHRQVVNRLFWCIVASLVIGTALVVFFENTLIEREFFRWNDSLIPNSEIGGWSMKSRPGTAPFAWWTAWMQLAWMCLTTAYVYPIVFAVLALKYLRPKIDRYHKAIKASRGDIVRENERRTYAYERALEEYQRMTEHDAWQAQRQAENQRLEAEQQQRQLRADLRERLKELENELRKDVRIWVRSAAKSGEQARPEWPFEQTRIAMMARNPKPVDWWMLRYSTAPDINRILTDNRSWLPAAPSGAQGLLG